MFKNCRKKTSKMFYKIILDWNLYNQVMRNFQLSIFWQIMHYMWHKAFRTEQMLVFQTTHLVDLRLSGLLNCGENNFQVVLEGWTDCQGNVTEHRQNLGFYWPVYSRILQLRETCLTFLQIEIFKLLFMALSFYLLMFSEGLIYGNAPLLSKS